MKLKLEEEIEMLNLEMEELRLKLEQLHQEQINAEHQLKALESERIKHEALIQSLNETISYIDQNEKQMEKLEIHLAKHKYTVEFIYS